MNAYGALAAFYDRLTGDIPYERFADFYESVFRADGGEFRLLLDLCCGTGTLTEIMARRGYELIAADASEDMLMQAREKTAGLTVPPLFLCQQAGRLDLYGTVDGAFCALDGINYMDEAELKALFSRLRLFIRPGGAFIFDIKTPESFKSLDGAVLVDEDEELLCLWRADFDSGEGIMCYGMDIFSREGELWRRESEEHIEYAHSPQRLISLLTNEGFTNIEIRRDCPQSGEGRIFITAKRGL